MLRGLLDDISKGDGVYANPNKRIKTTGSLRAPGAPVKPKPVPWLLRLPGEVRSRIYDYLIPDTTITLHLDRRQFGNDGYISPPDSAGHVYHRFPAAESIDCYDWGRCIVLANGAYGITLAHRTLRAESLVRVLQSATFECNDEKAVGVFTRRFPPLWRQHLQSFAGWFANTPVDHCPPSAPTDLSRREDLHWSRTGRNWNSINLFPIPTDPGRFPMLRKVQLNVPVSMYEAWPKSCLDMSVFKSATKEWLLEDMLQPLEEVVQREGRMNVVNAFMLLQTMSGLEWVVRRECLVGFCHEVEETMHIEGTSVGGDEGLQLEDWVTGPKRKYEWGRFMLEYNSKTGKLTRKLDEGSFVTNYQKTSILDAEMKERWALDEEVV